MKWTLRKINRYNEQQKGIQYYRPSQIEAFFDDGEPLENILLSGGSEILRNRALTRILECGWLQGYTSVIIHCQNRQLEHSIQSVFGSGQTEIINRQNPVYDPFAGCSNGEIARFVISSSENKNKVHTSGLYYLNGISDYIRASGKNPRCYMFIQCPHLTFLDGVSRAEMQGRISPECSRRIVSEIMQGETERASIENYFLELSRQAGSILCSKQNYAKAISLKTAAQQQKIVAVDIQTSANTILTNLLIQEMETLISQGHRLLVVFDEVSLSSSDALMNFIKTAAGSCSLTVSSTDVFASLGGSDSDFSAFAGRTSKILISRHVSACSARKLSEAIGFYEKQEITASLSRTTGYGRFAQPGTTQTTSIAVKRENIIQEEEIQNMSESEVYIFDKRTGELSFVPVL